MFYRYVIIIFSIAFLIQIKAQTNDTTSVSLLFAGDIMGHGSQIRAAYDAETNTYDYTAVFQYMKPVFSEVDFCIANLEVTLGTKPYSGYPQFSSPPALAAAIKEAGIDVLGTANNHSCDRRKKGIVRTVEILDSLKIRHLGTYKNVSEFQSQNPFILEKNNIKIALLNYTYGTNGIPVPSPTVVNLLDKKKIAEDVMLSKEQNPDFIIAFLHWGSEYQEMPNQEQQMWFDYFKSLGVSIVIGSHPHVIQPMYWDKANHNLVAYSLGNFVSNQRTQPRDGGAVFKLVLKKDKTLTYIDEASYLLTWVYKTDDQFSILPIDTFLYQPDFFTEINDIQKFKRFYKHVNSHLKKQNSEVEEWRPYSQNLFRSLINYF